MRINRKDFFFFGVIFLIGAALRLYLLGKISFWFDEASFCILPELSLSSLSSLFHSIIEAKFPPFLTYGFIFTFIYLKISTQELFLRLPSVFFSLGTVILFYLFTKKYYERKAALFGVFLLSCSPLDIYYSQEARMYTLLTFAIFLSFIFLSKAMAEKKNRYWLGYAFSCLLAMYTHYITIFVLLTQAIFIALNFKNLKEQISARWVFMMSVLAIFTIPFFVQLFNLTIFILLHGGRYDFQRVLSYLPKIGLINLFYTFKNLCVGYNLESDKYLLFVPVFFIVFIVGIMRLIKKEDFLKSSSVLLFASFPLLVFIVSLWRVIYVDRHFLPVLPFFCIIMGYGLAWFFNKKRIIFFFFFLVFVSAIFSGLFNYYRGYLPGRSAEHVGVQAKGDFRNAALYIVSNFKEGDIIIHTCDNTIYPFVYYFKKYGREHKNRFYVELKEGVPIFFEKKIRALEFKNNSIFYQQEKEELGRGQIRLIDEDPKIDSHTILGGNGRIWLVVSDWEFPNLYFSEHKRKDCNGIRSQAWFSSKFYLKDYKEFRGSSICLFGNKRKN